MGTEFDDCSALSPAGAFCDDDEVGPADAVVEGPVIELTVRVTETEPEAEPETLLGASTGPDAELELPLEI